MKRLFLAFALMFAMVAPASANKIFSHSYGSWELMAWSNKNHFCALKTYIDGKTLSIRLNSTDGLTVVVYDPNVRFRLGYASADIYFDHSHYGTYTESTTPDSPNQVFIPIGDDGDFLDKVKWAGSIQIESEDVDYNLNLIGTEFLGQYLVDCVRTYGF